MISPFNYALKCLCAHAILSLNFSPAYLVFTAAIEFFCYVDYMWPSIDWELGYSFLVLPFAFIYFLVLPSLTCSWVADIQRISSKAKGAYEPYDSCLKI